jgi:hypothetical protein
MTRATAGASGATPGAGIHDHDTRRLDRRRAGFNRMRYGAWTVPVEAASDVDDLRLHHDDLEELDEVQVHAEFLAAGYVLGSRPARRDIVARGWLVERRGRLRARLAMLAGKAGR